MRLTATLFATIFVLLAGGSTYGLWTTIASPSAMTAVFGALFVGAVQMSAIFVGWGLWYFGRDSDIFREENL